MTGDPTGTPHPATPNTMASGGPPSQGNDGHQPYIPASQSLPEIPLKAILLGIILSAVLISVGYIVGINIAAIVFLGGALNWLVATRSMQPIIPGRWRTARR